MGSALANEAETLADRQSFQLDEEKWEAFLAALDASAIGAFAAGSERAEAGCCGTAACHASEQMALSCVLCVFNLLQP